MVSEAGEGTYFPTSFSPWPQRAASELLSHSAFPGCPSGLSEQLAAEQKYADPQASPLFSWAGCWHAWGPSMAECTESVSMLAAQSLAFGV